MALLKRVILAIVVTIAVAHWDHYSHKGGTGKDKCKKPSVSDKGYAQLDDASKEKVDAVWANYVNGTNCTDQQVATKLVFDAFFSAKFLADTDAKAANLSAAAQAVYNQQIRPIITNTTLDNYQKVTNIVQAVEVQTDASIQAELKKLKPEQCFFFHFR